MMHESALGEKFNKIPGTNIDFNPPRDIFDLFKPQISIKLGAKHLKGKSDSKLVKSKIEIGATGKVCDYEAEPNQILPELNTKELKPYDIKAEKNKDKLWWTIRSYNGSNYASINYANEVCRNYHNAIKLNK